MKKAVKKRVAVTIAPKSKSAPKIAEPRLVAPSEGVSAQLCPKRDLCRNWKEDPSAPWGCSNKDRSRLHAPGCSEWKPK